MKQTSDKAIYDIQQIFGWIVEYKAQHDGNSPTLAEIMRACCISSKSVARYQLRRLQNAGLIHLGGPRLSRSICVIGGEWRLSDHTAI